MSCAHCVHTLTGSPSGARRHFVPGDLLLPRQHPEVSAGLVHRHKLGSTVRGTRLHLESEDDQTDVHFLLFDRLLCSSRVA